MNEKEIILACNIAWQEKCLELLGHKVGDEVFCLFHPDFGTAKQCNGTCTKGKGTIVRMEDGQIKIKSNRKYMHGSSVRKYPGSPVRFDTYWKYEEDFEYADLKSMLGVNQTEDTPNK